MLFQKQPSFFSRIAIKSSDLYAVDSFKIARICDFQNTRIFLNLGIPSPVKIPRQIKWSTPLRINEAAFSIKPERYDFVNLWKSWYYSLEMFYFALCEKNPINIYLLYRNRSSEFWGCSFSMSICIWENTRKLKLSS